MTQEHSSRVPRRESHLHGLLLVDKPGLQQVTVSADSDPPSSSRKEQHSPAGTVTADGTALPRLYTSHDIVQLVRRWSGQRRIGHTGTLDPMASGLMILCLGQATRLVEYYQGHDKTYLAEITLGQATDTYDAVGQVCATAAVPTLTREAIEQALQQFHGTILQRPPIYSALKQGGESLHRKARRGEAVTVEPRPVTIYQITLLDFQAPAQVALRVHCSAGTYIRSLAHDLGQALGTYAHLSKLRRTEVGAFRLENAWSLAAIEAAAAKDELEALLVPGGTALGLPEVQLSDEWVTRLGHGQKVLLPAAICQSLFPENGNSLLAKVIDPAGAFLGIIRCLHWPNGPEESSLWKAEKWLANA